MARQSVALQTFLANIEELTRTVSLIDLVWNMAAGIDQTWQYKDQFFSLTKNVDKTRLLGAIFLISHAAFEDFLRKLYSEVVQRVSDVKYSRSALLAKHPEILRNNYRVSGKALATVHEPIEYMNLNLDDIALNLGSSVPSAQPPVTLNSSAFAFLAPRPEIESVVDAYGKISFRLTKEKLVDSAELRGACRTKTSRETVIAIEAEFSEWVRLRNRLAHSQGEVRVIDVALVTKQHQIIKAFASRLDSLVS